EDEPHHAYEITHARPPALRWDDVTLANVAGSAQTQPISPERRWSVVCSSGPAGNAEALGDDDLERPGRASQAGQAGRLLEEQLSPCVAEERDLQWLRTSCTGGTRRRRQGRTRSRWRGSP